MLRWWRKRKELLREPPHPPPTRCRFCSRPIVYDDDNVAGKMMWRHRDVAGTIMCNTSYPRPRLVEPVPEGYLVPIDEKGFTLPHTCQSCMEVPRCIKLMQSSVGWALAAIRSRKMPYCYIPADCLKVSDEREK